MFRRLTLALLVAGIFAACDDDTPSPVAPVEQVSEDAEFFLPTFTLTLLHNNDAESSLLPDGDVGGIARFVSLVRELREEAEECRRGIGSRFKTCDVLLVSSGDNFLAGPQFQASLDDGIPYDAIGLDELGYDAIALGNHEFDFGPAVLADFIADVPGVPFLSANLDVGPEAALAGVASRIAAYAVVETDGGPVGIIGATTERLPEISSPGAVVVNAVLPAVQAAVDELEADGVNRIVLISHLQSVQEDQELIAQLRGVDIAVAGGGDELLAAPGNELLPGAEVDGPYPIWVRDSEGVRVPLVTTSGSYEYVGRLEAVFLGGRVIRVERAPTRTFPRLGRFFPRLSDAFRGSGPVPVIGGSPDVGIAASVEGPVQEAVDALDVNIGTTDIFLDGTRALVRTRETAYGSLIADAILAAAPGADIAMANGGGIRNSVKIGETSLPADVTRLDTFNTLPFANFVYTVSGVTPQRLKDVLENAVSNVEGVDGRFAQVAGFEFTYDASLAPGSRVLEVIVGGVPYVTGGVVDTSQPTLELGIVNFLANGGDGYPLSDLPVTTTTTTYQKALEDHIVALSPITAADVAPTPRITCVGVACPT